MKAYVLGVHSNDDKGQVIVFANNAKEARSLEPGTLDPENFIDLYIRRAPEFDNLENLSHKEFMKTHDVERIVLVGRKNKIANKRVEISNKRLRTRNRVNRKVS